MNYSREDLRTFIDTFLFDGVTYCEDNICSYFDEGEYAIIDEGRALEFDGKEYENSMESLIELVNDKFGCDIQLKCVGGYGKGTYAVKYFSWATICSDGLYFDSYKYETF